MLDVGNGNTGVNGEGARAIGGSVAVSGGIPLGLVEDVSATVPEFGETCGGFTFEPERLPLDMYFLVDSSGSMGEPTAGGGNKWDLVSRALIEFASAPENAQINAGIGYFPQGASPTCTAGQAGCLCIPVINICFANLGGSCEVGDYALPAVPLTVPPAPARLVLDLRARTLAGGTPTRPALEGTYRYLASWATQNPGRKVVAVLATDGEPTGCAGNSAANVAELARAALEGPHRIETFVIGVGRALANLNQVARAGGTAQAFLTDTQSDLQNDFREALEAIRSKAGPCTFAIPLDGEGGAIDPSLVNVRVTPRGQTEPSIVAKTFDGSAGACGPAGGWHYDDPDAPRQIQLCEATCRAASDARVQVQFGCETVVQLR